jgi:hypothetical protein
VFLVHLLIPLCLVMHVFGCLLTSKEIIFVLNTLLWQYIKCTEMNSQSQQKFLFFQKFSVSMFYNKFQPTWPSSSNTGMSCSTHSLFNAYWKFTLFFLFLIFHDHALMLHCENKTDECM